MRAAFPSPVEFFYIATQLFKNAANREIFLTFKINEERFNWLKRCYEEGKK
jgi:hypothetical protein